MGGGCGTTNTFYANQVAPAVMKEYGVAAAAAQAGGCGCMGASVAAKPTKNARKSNGTAKLFGGIIGGGGGGTIPSFGRDTSADTSVSCTGQPTMLRALGIMAGGKRRTARQRGGTCPCALGRFRGGYKMSNAKALVHLKGGYKPTKRDLAALRKYKAGKSIGFTMRSSLKAKGLIPRANGTKRISNKYR